MRENDYEKVKELALRLCDYGFSLLPLKPKEKIPYSQLLPKDKRGNPSWNPLKIKKASKDDIKEWFEFDQNLNIGILTGASSSGLVVLDVDKKLPKSIQIPITVVVRTHRGYHYYFKSNKKLKSELFSFGELKAEGGYVVAPGSIHPSGTNYEYVDFLSINDVEIAILPNSLMKHKKKLISNSQPDITSRLSHRNNSVTMRNTFNEIESMNQSLDVACKIMGLCGVDINSLGKPFKCPIPNHSESRPSASLWQEAGRPIILNDFHMINPNRRFYPLVDVFASYTIGKEITLTKGERAIWWIRALYESGLIDKPNLETKSLPNNAPQEANITYLGFCYLLELRQLYEIASVAPFNRNFASRWCRSDINTVRRGMEYLIKNKLLVIVERGRPINHKKGPALTLFSLG